MANRHRRHSSVDITGWLHTHHSSEPPPPTFLGRSISTNVSSFTPDVYLDIKRQTSTSHFNPGEYLSGCFGPRRGRTKGSSQHIFLEVDSAGTSGGYMETSEQTKVGRPPRSRSTSFLSNLGSRRSGSAANWKLELRAAELNRMAATEKDRVRQGGRWEIEADEYLKPPAWKQLLRKLRAHARRHVHPAPPREWTNYDAQSYEKNFDDGRNGVYSRYEEDDELGVRERALHTALLTKFHSTRRSNEQTGLLKTMSVPVPPAATKASKTKEESMPIWQRRSAPAPSKLELTRSL